MCWGYFRNYERTAVHILGIWSVHSKGNKFVNEINDHFLFKMDIKNKKLSK